MELTINERSLIALYSAPTLAETIQRMERAPVDQMEAGIQPDFLAALATLKRMDEAEYETLDVQDVLVTDEMEEQEVLENAGASEAG